MARRRKIAGYAVREFTDGGGDDESDYFTWKDLYLTRAQAKRAVLAEVNQIDRCNWRANDLTWTHSGQERNCYMEHLGTTYTVFPMFWAA